MPKKSSDIDEALKRYQNDEAEGSMILMLMDDGERVYLHPFEDEISALEFLEQMCASFRTDMIAAATKRGLN
jgi:hypothetical protein